MKTGEAVGLIILCVVVSAGVYMYMDYQKQLAFEEAFRFELELAYYRGLRESEDWDHDDSFVTFEQGSTWSIMITEIDPETPPVNVTRLELRELVENVDAKQHFAIYYDEDSRAIMLLIVDSGGKHWHWYFWWDE